MAQARNRLADFLSRWSKRLFKYLTDHEGNSGLARRIKLPLLGILVILIGWVSTGSVCIINCYTPLELNPRIIDASVTPNPTQGADTVTVKATAYFEDSRAENEEVYIDSAACYILHDADTVVMTPVDGEFGEPGSEEELTAKLYVGDIDPKTTYLFIEAWTNETEWWWTKDSLYLNITEAE